MLASWERCRFFGAEQGWALSLPMEDILRSTLLEPMDFDNVQLWPSSVGFAFLVPADVSLGIWFFDFVARRALGLARVDDWAEPVSHRVAFWGLVVSLFGCLAWYIHDGMSFAAAFAVFVMIL